MQNGANKSINDLKSALEKYFIPIPVVVRDLEKLVTHTIEELGIADKKIKESEVNLKSIADQALDKNKLR